MKNGPNILFSSRFRQSVEQNLGRDPLAVALDRRVSHAAAVASQVKYLARAADKLPSYYSARCVLPPLAFEQASSEATAARKRYSGALAVDLTCGLGVDAFWLSRRFERVIALERDAELAEVARENFRRLGADNILVINTSAEDFLATDDVRADLVYADPDRRGAGGRKLVRIEDCSPDIAALLPAIQRIAPRLAVKLSPMFDIDEVFRIFGPHTRAEAVSLGSECKEIVADVTFGSTAGPIVCAVAIDAGEAEYSVGDYPGEADCAVSTQHFEPERYNRLVIPDVALQKARLARRYFSERGVWIESDNGYGFATAGLTVPSAVSAAAATPREENRTPPGMMGKIFDIETIEPFDPKTLKRRLKAQNIKNIDILKRDFPLSTADIARRLGVREGGATKIAFTRAAGRLWQIHLRNR